MKTVCKLNQCAGCMACLQACRSKAVHIQESIRFYNAFIDADRCTGCQRCRSVCPVCTPPAGTVPFLWKQGWASDNAIREAAASGGIASAIGISFVRQGGVVYSCLFQDGEFRFQKAETPEAVRQFAGSKYVKSSPEGIYTEICQSLMEGRKVLFVGLPCQAAAVRNFTRSHEHLYLIDLICHGTPSPRLLDLFLQDCGLSLKGIRRLSFRRKNQFQLSAEGRAAASDGVWDAYTTAFCEAVSYTESCYSCKYAQLSRISDLTLGDSWGSELPKQEQKSGISLLLCQSKKGEELLSMADLHLEDVNPEKALSCNHQLQHPSFRHKKRDAFLAQAEQSGSVWQAAWKCFPVKFFKKSIKAFFLKLRSSAWKEPHGQQTENTKSD